MPSESTTLRAAVSRTYRRLMPWALALAVATCSDDQNGPSRGGIGYFAFKPVYGISNSLSQFGVVADSVHVLLTRPVNQVVLDTTVFFSPDSATLHLVLPILLETSPESLSAVIEIKAGPTLLFVDSLDVEVVDGPPSAATIPTVLLNYVGPGTNVAAITLIPGDTTIFLGDTLFFSSTAIDSSDVPVASFYTAWKTSDTTVAKINAQGRLIAPNLRGSVQVIGFTPTGIADTTLVTFAPVPVVITADSGAAQSGLAGDSLAALFVARVKGADSLGISGIAVRFAAVTAGGAVRDTFTLITDAQGRAKTRGVLGTTAGAYDYTATVVGTAISRTFSATATAGPAAAIAIQAGDLQVDSAGRALPLPFTVRVADAFNNPASGAKVYWLRTVGTGTLALDSSFTNGAGLATTGYTLGAVGIDSVTATLAGTSAFVAFQATTINGAAANISKFFGDAQSDTVGRLLTDSMIVTVRSATNQPVVGTTVTWSVIRGGGLGSTTSLTDVNGRAAVAYTLGTLSGIDSVRAQAGSVSAIFTETAVTGLATTLSLVSGDAQTDTTGTVLPLPFTVHATDTFGNSVAGTGVLFQRTAGTGTLAADTVFTNGAGLASVGYTLGSLPGTDSISGTLLCACSTVTFTATAVSAAPASIITVQGDSQTVTVNTTADTFAVRVRDASNNPIPGVKVDWAFIPAVGSFTEILPAGIQSTFTDSLGVARGVYTVGTQVGTVRVEASISGHIDSLYVFQVAAAPSAIAIQSGNNQTDTLGHAIALPFVVRVADAFNNPVAGSTVAFTRIAGSGTLFADTLVTDASGLATVGYLFGLIPGVDTIRADLVGTGANVNFIATAVPGVAATLNPVSGDAQTDTALATVAAPMVLQVLDAQGRQVPGAIVSFVGTGAVTPSQAVDTADLNGDVSVGIALGDTVGVWSVTATVVAVPALQAVYTFTTTPGAANLIALLSGDGQTDTLGKALTLPFVVHVTDASGNDVAGAPVIFTVTAGGGTLAGDTVLTSAAGQASIGYTLGATPGTNTVHAALGGTAAFVDFNAFAVNAFPASISPVSGSGQSAAVTTAFTDSLDVQVLDAGAAPIVNGRVIWTKSGVLTLSADTTFTDSLGHTNVRVTAGTIVGSFGVQATASGLAGPATFTLDVTAGAPSTVTVFGGDAQADTTGRTLPAPLLTRVTDAFGNNVPGAGVLFTVQQGAGLLSDDTVFTDVNGQASVNYTLGATPALDTIRATLIANSTFVDFTATAVGALPTLIVATQGDGQTGTVGVTLPTVLIVDVKDAGNNPIVGTGVVWTAVNGGSLNVDTTFTNGTGQAAANYTMGTLVGTDSVQATTLTGGLIATFTFTATADVPSQIATQSGIDQVDTAGRALPLPFTAAVYDAYNNPVAGATVLWSVITGTGTFSVDSAVTDSAGLVSTTYTLGTTPGLEDVRATLKGTSAFIDFFATSVSGAPALIAKILGDAQTDTVLSTLTDSLVVQLQDAASAPIPNSWIYWSTAGMTLSADSTLTDGNGHAAVQVTFGSIAVPAIVIAHNVDTTLAAVFTLKMRAGKTTTLSAVGGLGQTGLVDSTLPIDFAAFAQDAYGNHADSGVAVTWTNLVGFDPVGLPDTTLTDSTGVAKLFAPHLGPIAGEDSLTAQVLGDTATALFTATAATGPATSLVYVSGTGQTDTVGRSLSAPMVVQLRDAASNPVAGAWVQWKLISGGGAVPLDSTQTDGAGAASSSLTMGTVAGLDSISATFAGVTDTVVFYALAENDTATAITIISGDGQSATIGTAVSLPVIAEVQDQYGNPVDGITVTFTPSGLGSTVANPSVVTDASGQASSGTWTVDTLPGTSTLLAAVGALNKTAGAFALPIGTSKYWNGLVSTDWNDPSNWSPAGVPTASDNVFIPVSQPAPILSADGTTNDLTLQGGGTLDFGPNTLTINGSLFGGGASIFGAGSVDLVGSGTLDQLNVGVVHLSGSYALTSGAVAQVGYLQIDATGTLDLNGHALIVSGNLRQDGTLVMKAGSDSLDVLGNLDVTSFLTGAGNLTNGTMVLRGGLTQSGGTGGFQPTANHTTVFVGAGQNVDFQYPDSTNDGSGSYFNIVHFTDSTNFSSSVAFRGTVTVDTGKKVTSAGGTAGLNAALIGDVYADWNFNNTRFWSTPASLPDSLRGSLEFFNTGLALSKPLAVGGALRISDNSNIDLNGHWVRVDSAFHTSGTGQFGMTLPGDSLDIAGTATLDGGPGSFQDGVLVLRGDLSVPGISAVFQAMGVHRTRFAGTATQQVAFASPSLASNRFNTVEFDNAAGVNFNSDAAVQTRAEVKQGQVTGPGTISMSGDLVDSTNNAWRPEFTVIVNNSGLLPARLARSLELRGTTVLTSGFTVGGSLTLSGVGLLVVNGQTVEIDSNLVVTGGSVGLNMNNPADSVDVGFNATFDGADNSGYLNAGVLALHGDLAAPSSGTSFAAGGAHRTLLLGAIHTVSFPLNTGFTGNHFQDLEIPSGGSLINTLSDVYVAGTFTKAAGPTGTVQAPSQVQLQAHGLAVDNLNFDNVRVVYSGPTALLFDNVNFLNEDPALAQLQLDLNGGQVTLNNTVFQTTPTSGYYVAVADTESNVSFTVVDMYRSQPLDGTAHEFEIAGNDGATIGWTSLVFADQPLDILAGGTLAPVRLAILNPAGDTATFFTGNVTVAIGANPGSGVLSGTTTVAAVGGIAVFGDLSVDNGGIGYSLTANAAGLTTATSSLFNVTLPLPVGFATQWTGAVSNDWNTAGNWSGGSVPDSTTNVYISAVATNPAQVPSGTAFVNRIRIDSGATLDLPASILQADSSVEAFGAITGLANVELVGSGDITGTIQATVGVHGPYTVKGRADISGNLAVLDTGIVTLPGADTAFVGGVLGTNSTGRIVMSDANALLDVSGAANFFGGPTTGDLTLGTLRIAGDLTTGGSFPDAFAPSAGHVTLLNGSGVQTVDFATPDSVTGSHFGRLQVSTVGTAFMLHRYDALGDIVVTSGATLADSLRAGFEAHGFTGVDAGGTLAVGSLRMRGGLGVAVGATYAVGRTTYYDGVAFPINPAPYDTLVLQLTAVANGDFVVAGDLIVDGNTSAAGFDLGGHTVTVNGAVNVSGNGTLTMQNAADQLVVAGGFFTNGATTTGLLTDGVLQIGGDFRQAADGSGESFRASGNHTTRFTGGLGSREIKFDSPSITPTDLGGSHFAILDLPDGVDSINGRVAAATALAIGGSVTYDTVGFNNALASYGTTAIAASSDSVHIQTLESWGDLTRSGTGLYAVGLTRLMGGSGGTLPALPYQSLLIANTTFTLGADLVIPGNLDVGIYCSEVCTSSPGELAVGGHTLTVVGALGVMGLGQLDMAAGDSVDVTGAMTWRGAPNSGHLTGGTLVARGLFNMVGTDVFQADAAHRTVMLNAAADDIYPASNSWFGKLYLLGDARRIRTSSPLVVLDSLVLGSATAALSDTSFGANNGQLVAQGPIFTAFSSAITMNGSMRIDVSAPQIFGSYTVANTILGGTGQTVPNLTYGNGNIQVIGTAQLGSLVDIGTGSFTVDGSAGTADIDLNGQTLQVGDFTVAGTASLTSTTPGSGLLVRGNATFNGASETGRLTEGGITVRGFFAQDSLTSVSSYVSSGNHTTIFADSSFGGSQAVLASMASGASRFNHLGVYGNGVTFIGDARIDGSINMLDPLLADSVRGSKVRLVGTLNDPNNLWKVDTTVVIGVAAVLPDSIDKHLAFDIDYTLTNLLRVGGIVQIHDTVAVGGFTLLAHNSLVVEGAGVLQMTNPTDDVQVDGFAMFFGAPTGALMSAGRLTLRAGLNVPLPGLFNATGTHKTVLAGSGLQSITIDGSTGNAFNDLVVYAPQVSYNYPLLVHGTFADSVTASWLSMIGGTTTFEARRAELQNVQFTDATLTIGDSSQVDSVSIYQGVPDGLTQLTIRGAGRTTPLDLSRVMFFNLPTTGALLSVNDTVGSGDSLIVRMFSSTPFDGSTLTTATGLGGAVWSKLALSAPLPATFDSLVPFGLTMAVKQPDGSNWPDIIGSVDISLVNGGTATLNGGTTATFDGPNANFFGLTLDQVVTGAYFHFQMQSSAIDSFNTAPFDVINPVPAGSVIFTGATSTDWSDGSNWSTASVPGPTEDAFIPAGNSVFIPPSTTFLVNNLVLGTGANLDLGFGSILTVNGNAYAGQTITGSGSLVIAGGASQVSGTFPTLTVTGGATAVGRTSIAGDLIIDGPTAEFNVGGQFVDVSNTLFTQNSGLLTMDGAGDSLYVSSVSFSGGDETGRLTDGLLLIQGSNFDQGFGDANSFHASGNHLTIFGNGGSATAVNITTPASSQFAHVKVQNPNGVDFNESGLGFVRMTGNLTLSASGVVTGDTIRVDGAFTSDASTSVTLGTLMLGASPTLGGIYSVGTTWYTGSPAIVAAAPQGYQRLYIDNAATLGDSIAARTVFVTGAGSLDVNGFTLVTDTLQTVASATLLMDAAEDTVVVDSLASFGGANSTNTLTAGLLLINGGMAMPNGLSFQAQPGHLTRIQGTGTHLVTVSPSAGPQFGALEAAADTVNFIDPGQTGTFIAGGLTAIGTVVADSANQHLYVDGTLHVTPTGNVTAQFLRLSPAIDFQGADSTAYRVATTLYTASGTLLPAPYNALQVDGSYTLGGNVTATNASIISAGQLVLNGNALTVADSFTVTDNAHLLMLDAADTLWVGGLATFEGPDATGDLTAGVIRAKSLLQQQGPSSSDNGFVQTGTAQVAPQADDTIRMTPTGPAGSRIAYLNLSNAGGPVVLGNVWVTDSMINSNPGTTTQTFSGADNLTVYGKVDFTTGSLNADTLAVGGTLSTGAAAYNVFLTKFVDFGGAQTIPVTVPYHNVEVYYAASLEGDLDLLTGGYSLVVRNTGVLDLAGHSLLAGRFETQAFGALKMTDPADTLRATNVVFDGTTTAGLLTDGVLQVGNFTQADDNDPLSFAPSGAHVTEFVTIGLAPESGYSLQMAGSAGASGSHFHRLHLLSTAGTRLFTNVWVDDSLYINNSVFGSAYSMTGQGPIVIDNAAAVALDSLIVGGSLQVDPSATYTVANTVFGPIAAPMPALNAYQNVYIEGAQTLTDTLAASNNIFVRQGGSLTPNGHKVAAAAVLYLQDNARLVMAPADTVEAGDANFNGAASGSDLAGGILRLRSGLASGNSTSSQSFAPTGMVVEFYGGGTANIDMAVVSPSNSYIDTLRVIEGTTISPQGDFLAMGPAVLKDGSTFDGNSSISALDFRKGLTVLDTSIVNSGGSATIFFEDSLTMATPANYAVASTRFGGTKGIPDLPYQGLIIDSVQMTLDHPLTASGQMQIIANTPGATQLQLGGFSVRAQTLDIGGYAQIGMADPLDSLISTGNMTFAGGDETGILLAGTIRVGGDLGQNGFFSSKSLRTDGVKVEFYGPSSHMLSFTTPGLADSYLGNVAILSGGSLYLSTASTFNGRVDVGPSSLLDLGTLTAAASDFYGPVTAASGATITTTPTGFGVATFHDTLLVDPAATYSVVNTAFAGIDTIPDITYQNLYLWNGTHAVLGNDITTAGSLIVDAPTGSASLTVNGHNVLIGGQFTLNGNATLVMTNAADQLNVTQNANFGGGDEAGLLTAGTIQIGGGFTQTGTFSDRAFRSTGTTVRFTDTGTQQVTFATPDSSWFADVADQLFGTPTLNLNITGRMKATGTVGAYGTIISGDSLEVGTLSAGPVGGSVTLDRLKAGSINGGFSPFTVGVTELAGSGILPLLGYDSLIVTGTYSIPSFGGSFTGPLTIASGGSLTGGSNAATIAVTGDVVVDGGLLDLNGDIVATGGNFSTLNGGLLQSTTTGSALSVVGNASFAGGTETGLLQLGQLAISGDFFQGGINLESFVADSGFTTQFGGTGTHQVYFSTPSQAGDGGSHFGSLSFTTDAGLVLNVMSDIWAEGLLTTTGGSTPTLLNGTVPLRTLTAQDVSIQGITFDHVQFHLAKTGGVAAGAGSMDIVNFQNFLPTEDQFLVDLPGEATAFSWANFSFSALDPGGTDTGHYIVATDTDGGIPSVLIISLGTNQAGDPVNYFFGANGAVVSPFAP